MKLYYLVGVFISGNKILSKYKKNKLSFRIGEGFACSEFYVQKSLCQYMKKFQVQEGGGGVVIITRYNIIVMENYNFFSKFILLLFKRFLRSKVKVEGHAHAHTRASLNNMSDYNF